MKKERKKYEVEPTGRQEAYMMKRLEGKSGVQAATEVGYVGPQQASRVENSKGVAVLKERYADKLQEKVTMDQIAEEHAKIIMQDEELGPKTAAIKMAMDKIEPPDSLLDKGDDRVFVLLKSR